MPESSGDPHPTSSASSERPSPEAARNNLTRAPRANPPTVYNPRDVPPQVAPPGFAELLEWMKTMAGGAAPTDEPSRQVLPKEQKKFARRTDGYSKPLVPLPLSDGNLPPVGDQAPGSATVTDSPEEPSADRPRAIPPETYSVERKRRSKEATSRSATAVLLTQLLAFGLIVVSFFVGRATVSRNAARPVLTAPSAPGSSADDKTPGPLPANLMEKVDQSSAAESAGDYKRALALLDEVQAAGGRVVGMNYHRAVLLYALNELPQVLPLLNTSIAGGEQVAACYNLRGTMNNRQGGIGKGLADLETASNLDPFDAKYAFFVGEALRRMGKPQAALPYLQRAAQRAPDAATESFYLLKIRLTKIELGREKEFADELKTKLALSPPPLDWIFTAAAVAMHRGDMQAAAGFLDRVSVQIGTEEMDSRLRDFYFYSFAHEKELARFYASVLHPQARASTVDANSNPVPGPAESPSLEVALPAADLPKSP